MHNFSLVLCASSLSSPLASFIRSWAMQIKCVLKFVKPLLPNIKTKCVGDIGISDLKLEASPEREGLPSETESSSYQIRVPTSRNRSEWMCRTMEYSVMLRDNCGKTWCTSPHTECYNCLDQRDISSFWKV